MCDEVHNERVKSRLLGLLADLDNDETRGASDRATVTLDQQSVGRLSRMDALQRQAMAQATQRRLDLERRRIMAALARLDEGEYGYCVECGEDIPPARLEVDPCVTLCVSCARG